MSYRRIFTLLTSLWNIHIACLCPYFYIWRWRGLHFSINHDTIQQCSCQLKQVFSAKSCSFTNPYQVLFVPEPNKRIITALTKDKIENWTKTNGKLPCQDRSSVKISVLCRNLYYQHQSWWSGCVLHSLNKCAVHKNHKNYFWSCDHVRLNFTEANIHNLLTSRGPFNSLRGLH